MSVRGRAVEVTLSLPSEIYERAARAATDEQRPLDELLSGLVAEGLDAHLTARERLERLSEQYRARLSHQKTLDEPPEQVVQALRDLRERLAGELYP
jgi:hypothetical protein